MVFRRFETFVQPYPDELPPPPPLGFFRFMWECTRGMRGLLLMVTLVYAFLLSLLASEWEELRHWLLRTWCHRTGKRSREVAAPLYRLLSALSRLWQAYLPSPGTLRLNSG